MWTSLKAVLAPSWDFGWIRFRLSDRVEACSSPRPGSSGNRRSGRSGVPGAGSGRGGRPEPQPADRFDSIRHRRRLAGDQGVVLELLGRPDLRAEPFGELDQLSRGALLRTGGHLRLLQLRALVALPTAVSHGSTS